MPTPLRIATFNLENFDDPGPTGQPSLTGRIAVTRPQLERLAADVLCVQEVNAQEQNGTRNFAALDQLLAGTMYAPFHRVSTTLVSGATPPNERNLLVLSRFPISTHRQIKHDITPRPAYRRVTANPSDAGAIEITWERPLLLATINVPDGPDLHVINLHLKSKLPTDIPGQHPSRFVWNSASGWAEGAFVSAMKRVGQALELRMVIDALFDSEPEARIVAAGDFNADIDEVPLEAIRGDVENTGNPALISRLMIPCERNIPTTSRFSLYHHGRPAMLDHILVSRALLPHWRATAAHNESCTTSPLRSQWTPSSLNPTMRRSSPSSCCRKVSAYSDVVDLRRGRVGDETPSG
jgi:endonuclease/exonuclease/phosphatase family metal-dependent hydrolase